MTPPVSDEDGRSAGAGPAGRGVDARGIAWLSMMGLMLFALMMPFSSYVAALSYIREEWGAGNTQLGAVYSAYLAGYAVSALIVIPLTDRVGPKPVFLLSACLSVIAHVLFALTAHDMAAGAALRAVAGVGLVGIYMPGLRLISDRFPVHGKGLAIGSFVTAFYTAHSVSLTATGGLMAAMEWRDAYLVMAVASAAAVPMAYALIRGHRHVPGALSSGRLDLGVLRNREARYLITGYSLHALELYAVRMWLPAFLMAVQLARGADAADAAVTAATVGGLALMAGGVGPLMGGVISDRWGRSVSAMAVFALSGLCAWVIGWTTGLPWAAIVALAVVYGWAIAADSAIYSTGVTEVTDRDRLGSTQAIQAFVGFMGGVVGPVMVGGILDVAPDSMRWTVGFSSLGVVAVLAIVVLARLRSAPRSRLLAAGRG